MLCKQDADKTARGLYRPKSDASCLPIVTASQNISTVSLPVRTGTQPRVCMRRSCRNARPCQSACAPNKTPSLCGYTANRILNHGIILRLSSASRSGRFTPPRYPLGGGATFGSGRCGEEIALLPLPGTELWFNWSCRTAMAGTE